MACLKFPMFVKHIKVCPWSFIHKFQLLNFHITFTGIENEKSILSEKKLEKKFGQSPVFVASTLLENGGTLKGATPASLLKEAIHVISCGYEDKTDWGKEVILLNEPSNCLIMISKWLKICS